jgi:hypothetical protein
MRVTPARVTRRRGAQRPLSFADRAPMADLIRTTFDFLLA